MSLFREDALKKAKKKAKIEKDTYKKHTILIVDDEENNLLALADMLDDSYNVLVAQDGQDALELIQKDNDPERINLIISDQRMPRLNGVDFLEKSFEIMPKTIRIILTGYSDVDVIIDSINKAKIHQYIMKPFDNQSLRLTIKRALETYDLEEEKALLIGNLRQTNYALQEAMRNLYTIEITPGVHWVQVPEADLYILCGCPADVVKHMMRKGLISTTKKGEVAFETGPNAILLSDVLIQNGKFSNLAEFPILQMLYRQGMILPDHPNNSGIKPILIGSKEQVYAQMQYIYRGNYGLISMEEIMEAGVSEDMADEMMRLKMKFAFGKIRPTEEFLSTLIVEDEPIEIKNEVFIQRVGFNKYEFQYKGKSVVISLNLEPHETYEPAFALGFHNVKREYFAVIHSGEGDGWDINRPCMGSILMFQGKVFLIDAGPNMLSSLRALGIDITEIVGIFHTHAHDDHFAGLPTLMQSDHRIKYYSTPVVRASVTKKLSALMSMEEEKFSQFFKIQDLAPDTWNDLDGLEVKPIYSPHPLETNIFLFRALGETGYRTYAHWADIASFEVLKNMVSKDISKEGISREFYETTKNNYIIPADLKKVDIGGGLIHGQVDDFREDKSKKIILSHTASNLSAQQKEIGSETSFGTLDLLISTPQNYLLKQASQYLEAYFPNVPFKQFRVLLNSPLVSFNPGAIIQKKGDMASHIFLILAGSVEFIQSGFNIQNNLSNGCFIGDVSLLRNTTSPGTWKAISHVHALRFPNDLYYKFLEKNRLQKQMSNTWHNIEFLQQTLIFGEGISYLTQNKIAQIMTSQVYNKYETIPIWGSPGLYLLKEGELQITNPRDEVIERLKMGDFFGEESLFSQSRDKFQVQTTQPSTVYSITDYPLLEIPIVHWKLLETSAKRKSILKNI